MKKRVAVILSLVITIFLLFQISFIYAQDNETELTGFEKAYDCLKEEIEAKGAENLVPEEQAFSLLALAYDSSFQSDLKSALEASGSGGCWPKDSCNLKDTSLALLAFEYIGADTDDIENWLLNQTTSPTELIWYLQIDQTGSNEGGMDCTIKYRDTERTITIGEDKKIRGSAGACLRVAKDGYWLEIDNDCYDEEFEISCDDDFITALIYRKKGDETYYISTLTHTGIVDSTTYEEVKSLCFKQGTSCNYEGSLWATFALRRVGKNYDAYLPYLITLASDNSRYLPSAFLYMITNYDEYFNELVSEQEPEGYWQTTSGKRYYDTALALLALEGISSEQKNDALDYLLEGQPESGCWGSPTRDTAFILYAAAPKRPASVITTRSYCEDFEYYCSTNESCEEAGGDVLENYWCLSSSNPVCCSKSPEEETCEEQGGEICTSTQDCTGSFVTASDTSYCCVNGECVEAVVETECEKANPDYVCKPSCDPDTEIEKIYDCTGLDKCCAPKPEEKMGYWWVWILILLVILLVLAIIYRNQLKVWLFRIKNKFKKGPVAPAARPAFPPAPAPGKPPLRVMPRRILPTGTGARPTRLTTAPTRPIAAARPVVRPFPKQKEFDQTLKKLKEMGK